MLTVLRNGEKIDVKVVPSGEDGYVGIIQKTQLHYLEVTTKEYGFFESIPAGFYKTGNVITRYIDQFKVIFTKEGVSQLGGFGTIAKIYGN